VLEVDLPYQLLRLKVYRCHLITHELLLRRLATAEYFQLAISSNNEQHLVVLAGEFDTFLLA
jgi:hypothetical protein